MDDGERKAWTKNEIREMVWEVLREIPFFNPQPMTEDEINALGPSLFSPWKDDGGDPEISADEAPAPDSPPAVPPAE